MDIAMPGMGGLEATRLIHEKHPETRVLVLTQHEEPQYVMSLLQAGASGYVFKRALGSDLIAALRAVARGETLLHPPVSAVLVEGLRRQAEAPAATAEPLTPREKEILQYIVRGQTNAQIAEELFLSVKTVEWHRTNLMSKLDVHNVVQLVRYALEHGLAENAP
jgi:DNA-binding NarL/FixJ family response regulator